MKKQEEDMKKFELENNELVLKKKFEDLKFYDEMKRRSWLEQKKNYQQILDQQVKTWTQSRIDNNNFRILDFREKTHEKTGERVELSGAAAYDTKKFGKALILKWAY